MKGQILAGRLRRPAFLFYTGSVIVAGVSDKPKIIIIVGPTASGKTGLSIKLAKKFNGEVISADSRQVYRGLDIGSAKISRTEMDGIPHHLLDVANPNDVYTAADFKRDAANAVEDILSRGKLPIVCGGTFFYIDALLGKVAFPEVEPDEELRAELQEKSAADLLSILEKLDPERVATIEKDNPRRLIRAIEIAKALGKVPILSASKRPYEPLVLGLLIDINTHAEIIKERIIERLDIGMVEEVQKLLKEGVAHERLESLGLEYRYISRYLRGIISREEMIEELTVKSRQFAKRQMTWLRRDNSVKWFDRSDPSIEAVVESFLKSD